MCKQRGDYTLQIVMMYEYDYAGADVFTFHVCVCCSVWKQQQKLGPTCLCSMFVCVAVGGSNGRS